MIKKNFYSCNKRNANPNYFNGNVIIRDVYTENDSNEQEVYFVEFLNGALTTMHFHETEQILIPVYGKGVIGELKKNSISNFDLDDVELNLLDVGEIVSISPNILHFHGALPEQNFTHIAFRKLFDNKGSGENSHLTKTKWIADFISDELGSNDQGLIKNTLKEISYKINQSVASILT